jgi:putative ABC transport system ATP-binding protein
MFLKASHVNKQVQSADKQIVILQDVNLEIKLGETIAILGPSGSGKTTLLTLLAGLDLPTSGDIYLEKNHISAMSEENRARMRKQYVGFIFQSFQLLPSLTALENVMLPLEIQYVSNAIAKQQATEWLAKVGLSERLNHYPAKLSGGEQQRVAIARAFVTEPKIIFSDEMTGNLDEKTGEMVSDILFSLNKKFNTTLVLVTHDSTLASHCQKKYLLTEGKLQSC